MASPETLSNPIPPEYRLEGQADIWSDKRKVVALIKHLTLRHLNQRYRGSALGFMWSLLNPILMMLVYTFVFRFIFRASVPGVPYPAFFLTGFLAWTFFATATANSAASVIEGHYLLKKSYIPPIVMPLSAVFSNFVNYLVTLPLLVAFNFAFGVRPGLSILLAPFALLLLLALATSLGLIFSSLAPFFRDLLQLLGILFTAWFFASPVLYPYSLVVKNLGDSPVLLLYRLNPAVGAIRFIHAVFLGESIPLADIGIAACGTAVLFGFGIWVFNKLAPRYPEVI